MTLPYATSSTTTASSTLTAAGGIDAIRRHRVYLDWSVRSTCSSGSPSSCGQDLARSRTRDRAAVAALLDDDRDGVPRLVGRRVPEEPRVVVLARDLRGAGLARHRHAETAKRARAGTLLGHV